MTDHKSILEELGFKLIDRGSFWHSNAAYRDGDNNSALQIYKNSGVWKDFVEDTDFLPFEVLLEKTLNTTDKLKIRAILKGSKAYSEEKQESNKKRKLLQTEKTYDPKCLKKLLPHFDFYNKKGISRETLLDFKCGLATGGKLYQRIVFPIFNKEGKIQGFSGRKVNENNPEVPKWLHMGKKRDWLYPYYTTSKTKDKIEKTKSAFLIESVGDSLSLYDSGIENNLVCFGISISPRFISQLASMELDRIYISLNNDADSERNRGFEGAYKVIIRLLDTIDFKRIYFAPPPQNDFGSMNKVEIEIFRQECMKLDHKYCMSRIIEIGKQINAYKPQGEVFIKALRKLIKKYEFHYE